MRQEVFTSLVGGKECAAGQGQDCAMLRQVQGFDGQPGSFGGNGDAHGSLYDRDREGRQYGATGPYDL